MSIVLSHSNNKLQGRLWAFIDSQHEKIVANELLNGQAGLAVINSQCKCMDIRY